MSLLDGLSSSALMWGPFPWVSEEMMWTLRYFCCFVMLECLGPVVWQGKLYSRRVLNILKGTRYQRRRWDFFLGGAWV